MGLPRLVPTSELSERDLPEPNAGFSDTYRFALTFDCCKYADTLPEINPRSSNEWLARLSRLARSASLEFERDGSLPPTIDDLRACLSFEAKRYRLCGDAPGYQARVLPYLRALIEAIRHCVRNGQAT
jgi:hypothetical protein